MNIGALPRTPRFIAFDFRRYQHKNSGKEDIPAADTLEPRTILGVAPQRYSYPPCAESSISIT